MRAAVILVAAGAALRFGEDKIRKELLGKPLLRWTMEPFQAELRVTSIILVLRPELVESSGSWLGESKVKAVLPGGLLRRQSVQAGLQALAGEEIVLIHDGARPCLSSALLGRVLDAAELYQAVVPARPIRETVKECTEDMMVTRTVTREGLWLAQTPQAFRRKLLLEAYASVAEGSPAAPDDAFLVERLGYPVHLVLGESSNLKVTEPVDLLLAEAVLRERGKCASA